MRTRPRALPFLLLALLLWAPQCLTSERSLAASSSGVEELIARARAKVVLIQIEWSGPTRWGTGFIAERGRVITNEHVVRAARRVTVWANGTPYGARVASVDLPRDLAVLVLPGASLALKPLALAPDARGRPGEPVVILASRTQPVGAGRGAGRVVRVSPVEGTAWDYAWLYWTDGPSSYGLRLQARAIPGDSGSPVLRLRDGAVVGVLRGRTHPDANGRSETAWAVPVEALHALLQRLRPPASPSTGPERFYLQTIQQR